ncbi:crotonase/enoyl-CoA hydratase family protein [soil metagenome]
MSTPEVSEPVVLVEKSDGIFTMTLNRPGSLNAISSDMAVQFSAALFAFEADPHSHVAIVTGTGRAFCAGVDLKAIAAGDPVDIPEHPEWGMLGFSERYVAKPVIAAVNGLALGAGTELMLACDLAILSDAAFLGLPEVTRGIFPGGGGAIRLPRQMPMRVAMRYLLTGDRMSADEALRWGLVNDVVPAEDLLPAARALATKIASNAPLSVQTTKKLAYQAWALDTEWDAAVWQANLDANHRMMATADAKEGPAAFAEKRTPRWTGA